MEVALAYKCENNLTSRDLLQYVHHNRDNNARRIETMGKAFSPNVMFIAQNLALASNVDIPAQGKLWTRLLLNRMRNLKSKREEQRQRWRNLN